MLTQTLKSIRTALTLLIILTLLTGLVYPGIVTIIAQVFFPWRANGSLILQDEKTVGSALIGQNFTAAKYFWGRPSATKPFAYNAANSSGSNLGPANPELLNAVTERMAVLQKSFPANKSRIPLELVTSSASGLDPDISLDSAYYQMPRIAQVRNISVTNINYLIKNLSHGATVNVLELNLALDQLTVSGKK